LWSDLWGKKPIYEKDNFAPDWKKDFESKNRQFYLEHRNLIDSWLKQNTIIRAAIPSKRKLEWQAQDMASIWDGLIHFRPSQCLEKLELFRLAFLVGVRNVLICILVT
jgi:DNA (cytosine-5)-methyltransferase 1